MIKKCEQISQNKGWDQGDGIEMSNGKNGRADQHGRDPAILCAKPLKEKASKKYFLDHWRKYCTNQKKPEGIIQQTKEFGDFNALCIDTKTCQDQVVYEN